MPALCPDPPCQGGGGSWRHTVTLEAIRGERLSMEPEEFARAYGNVPDLSGQGANVADFGNWPNCADPGSLVVDPVALAFAVAPGGASAAIAVGGRRVDGLGHGELVEHRPGTAWLMARLLELADAHQPCVLVMNPSGAAGSFEAEPAERGFVTKPGPGERLLQVVSAREYAQACGALADDVKRPLAAPGPGTAGRGGGGCAGPAAGGCVGVVVAPVAAGHQPFEAITLPGMGTRRTV
jgi:hypothetical protein